MPKAIFNIAYTSARPPANLRGDARAEYVGRRQFYNLTADYNFFSYALNGSKVVKNATAEDYFTRSNTNAGLFNLEGAMTSEQVEELRAKLKETESTIWHGFISFDEETSKGFDTQENAIKFLRQTFPSFLARTHLDPKNIELYAALHDDTDNRHIHFAFFEKEPKRRNKNGVLGYTWRGNIDSRAIDNYLVSANMHLDEHADEYYSARDRALGRLKELRGEIKEKGAKGTPRTVVKALRELAEKLPKEGRLQYNAENMKDLRPIIDRVGALLIASDPESDEAYKAMMQQFARIEGEVKKLALENKLGYVNGKRLTADEMHRIMQGDTRNKEMPVSYLDMSQVDYLDRLKDDYRARVGNAVIAICRQIDRADKMELRRRFRNKGRMRKVRAKNKRRRRESILQGAAKIFASMSRHTQDNFLKSVQEIEREQEIEKLYGKR
ncbi:MAG: relaxase MobL [Clostridia bacterium]|nr:relaxase MobL [Clostridia bacterium]